MNWRIAVFVVYLASLGLQGWLCYSAVFWAWVSMTPQANPVVAQRMFGVCCACMFGLLVLQIGGATFLIRRSIRNARRYRENACAHCGYNLAGNVSGRCPECGVACGIAADGVGPAGGTQ